MESFIYKKKVLIFGCGNTLFGNDGFGPNVVNYLIEHYNLSEDIFALDAGTGISNFIFDLLLMKKKPEMVLIIDAVTISNHCTGDVFEVELSKIPQKKMSDFALHQAPCSDLLSLLKTQGVDVRVLGMHTAFIPNKINPGLCPETKKAVPIAADWIMEKIKNRTSPPFF